MPRGRKGRRKVALPIQPHPALPEGAGFQHRYRDARAEAHALPVPDAAAAAHEAADLGAPAVFGILAAMGVLHDQRQGRQQQELHLAARTARASRRAWSTRELLATSSAPSGSRSGRSVKAWSSRTSSPRRGMTSRREAPRVSGGTGLSAPAAGRSGRIRAGSLVRSRAEKQAGACVISEEVGRAAAAGLVSGDARGYRFQLFPGGNEHHPQEYSHAASFCHLEPLCPACPDRGLRFPGHRQSFRPRREHPAKSVAGRLLPRGHGALQRSLTRQRRRGRGSGLRAG